MTQLVEKIVSEVPCDCLVKGKLTKSGCDVLMNEVPTHSVVIDLDKHPCFEGNNRTHCDYIMVATDLGDLNIIVPLELKKGDLDPSDALKQLQAGADFAMRFITAKEKVEFLPYAASGNTRKLRKEGKKVSDYKIKVRGKLIPLRRIECGEALPPAIYRVLTKLGWKIKF